MKRLIVTIGFVACFALFSEFANAGLIGGNIQISGGGCRFPDVAYGSVSAKYLVVWTDYNVAKVFGRLVTNGGVVSGNIFGISESGALFPAVAYNATNNEFLVTWDDQRGPTFPIWGQRVRGSDGVLLGTNFQIGASEGIRSAVAWSSGSNVYAVTYWTNGSETYVQRVGGQGGLVGGEINASQDAAFSGYPAIAYGSTGNQFLVSWDSDTGNIYARRVDAGSGALLGGVVVMTAGGTNDRSCIAYDSVNSRWAVAYNKQIAGLSYNQWGRNINTSGTMVTAEYPIANTPGFEGDTNFGGDIAFVPGLAQFFSSFGTDTGWGGQPVDASGNSIGTQIVLGTGFDSSGNNAADTALSRFLPVWEGSVANVFYVWGQLYQADPAPPGPVTNLVANSSSGQNILSWTNPTDPTFTATLIRYRTDTYPTSPTDGTLVVDKANSPGTNDSVTHSGLTNGTTYYYSVWAHSSIPLYSNVRNVNATPTPAVCFTDSFVYADGNLNGNGGWAGSATNQIQLVSQTVKVNGGATSFDAVKNVNCGDPGTGYIRVAVKIQAGTGSTTMWSLWYNDPAGVNICRWYGTGTTAKGRIGTTATVTATQTLTGGWDDLVVKITPAALTAEFFFNSMSIGVLSYNGQGAGNTVGKLRFERIDNSGAAGNFVSFDDLVIGDPGSPPPGQATNPSPANGATLVPITSTLTWTAGSGATSHDVRFGTVNPPPFIQNQPGTSYTPPTMTPNTTYFWRIDEKNGSGTTTGTVWSFTTLPVPGLASAPNPANGATLVSITSGLSWTAGSNASSHDVRFGTANPPPFIQNQAGTSYTPPTMAPNTTYFWRIDEKNSSGTTTGTVWSFTTLPLPGLASAPNPANAATGVSITATLSWTAGSNATSHDVHFGTANPPPFVVNQAGTTYNPGALVGNTVYFWRIDEKNSSGTTTGTVWTFTTTSCFNDSFPYANGNLNGNGGWSGSATTEIQIVSQTVKINGGAVSKDSIHTTSCGASGTGLIQIAVKVQAGTGTNTMWSLWFDDPAGINICRWYGSGTTARGRIGGSATVTATQTLTGGLDALLVKINPTAKTAEFFFNSVSIGVLDYSAQGAASTLARVRFERIDNSGAAGNSLTFDNLVVY